jgi:hypothetical protein
MAEAVPTKMEKVPVLVTEGLNKRDLPIKQPVATKVVRIEKIE